MGTPTLQGLLFGYGVADNVQLAAALQALSRLLA
jgi:hypothetical protein